MPKDSQFQPLPTATRRAGTISQWDDGKGCGWVKSGGTRAFLHIREFERPERKPRLGDEVTFIEGIDAKGRECAKAVRFVKTGVPVGAVGWCVLAGLLVLPVLAVLALSLPLWVVPTAMVVISAVCYWMYAHDKQQAVDGGWRVAETWLHLAELLGGWPGAFLAQRRLRHKSRKVSYRVFFWMIVMIHQIAAVDVLLDHRLSAAVLDRVIEAVLWFGENQHPGMLRIETAHNAIGLPSPGPASAHRIAATILTEPMDRPPVG